MTGAEESAGDKQELLSQVKTRRDKVLRFDIQEEGAPYTWYVGYHGNFGWSACRGNGTWEDDPEEEEVEWALDMYDDVQLVSRSDLPEEVSV